VTAEAEEDIAPELVITCSACTDAKPMTGALTLACSHAYCHDCITYHLHSALKTDITLFPPRCCREPIPMDDCRAFLPAALVQEAETKQAAINEANAIYCSRSSCGALIVTDRIVGGVATCVQCCTQTCIFCKEEQHDGLCPEDDDTKSFLTTAEKVKWQRCSRCKNMVELDSGCFHIT
jgi:hypothetical protein